MTRDQMHAAPILAEALGVRLLGMGDRLFGEERLYVVVADVADAMSLAEFMNSAGSPVSFSRDIFNGQYLVH